MRKLQQKTSGDVSIRRNLIEQIDKLQGEVDQLSKSIRNYEAAQLILQELGLTLQNHAQRKIAGVVTQCLKVFGNYDFRIEFETKRGGTAATFVLTKDGLEIDPLDSGGGIIDVIAFALRVSVLLARKPLASPLLVLDEPFKFVSANFRPVIGDLVEKLSEELGVQFLIVTHIPELMRGKVIEL